MSRLRVGIIGLGVGEQHIAGYHRHPNCQVVALCDFDPEKRDYARGKYPGLGISSDANELLTNPDIDAVSIASYDNYHFEQIKLAIEHNKHLFVEKPLCLYREEAVAIRSLLDAKPHLQLSSNLILRLCPRFIAVRELIQNRSLGTLFSVEGDYNYGRLHKITDGWRGELPFYSAILGGGVHLVDLLLWLTEKRVVEVQGYGNNIVSSGTSFRHNDYAILLLKFEDGMLGKVSANLGCVFPHFHTLTLYGTDATFVNGQEVGLLYTGRGGEGSVQTIDAAYPGVQKGDLILSFVESIFQEQPAVVSKEDVFQTMSVCFAMEQATRQTGPVTVEYL